MLKFFEKSFYGNTILNYLIFIAFFLFCIHLIKLIKRKGLKQIKSFFKKKKLIFGDSIIDFLDFYGVNFLYLLTFYLSLGILNLSTKINKIHEIFGIFLLVGSITIFITELIDWIIKNNLQKKDLKPGLKAGLPAFSKIIKFSFWIIALVFLMENLGFHISTLVAGLGIGGIAIAFASQMVLKDLLSYISILIDQPFAIGDFIIVGEFMGNIEHIGIKTTRLRSLSGELLIFSNTDLTESRLRNYQLMKERRVLFQIGITYNTSLEKIKAVPEILKTIIVKQQNVRYDRAHFFKYGDFSLIYEIVYYVISSDYNQYMNIQQSINFEIKEEFEKNQIEFAYPTQTLLIHKN